VRAAALEDGVSLPGGRVEEADVGLVDASCEEGPVGAEGEVAPALAQAARGGGSAATSLPSLEDLVEVALADCLPADELEGRRRGGTRRGGSPSGWNAAWRISVLKVRVLRSSPEAASQIRIQLLQEQEARRAPSREKVTPAK
jgi:hypothetical protein